MNSGQEISGELIISGGDAAEVLEAAESVFDEVASTVVLLAVADGALAVAATDAVGRNPARMALRAITACGARELTRCGICDRRLRPRAEATLWECTPCWHQRNDLHWLRTASRHQGPPRARD